MIVVTGGAGFIGSALLWRLNQEGINDIVVVDRFGSADKWRNIAKRRFYLALHKDEFLDWLKQSGTTLPLKAIFHLGACSSTGEHDMDYLLANNVHYSRALHEFCTTHGVPLIYASSAATYGAGESGYSDELGDVGVLTPLNPYGFSKKMFDVWAQKQPTQPPFWAGLKFFNVFGPNEYHKAAMRSLVCKAVPEILSRGELGLFKSYRKDVEHGEQRRDFIYVKDVVDVILHFYRAAEHKDPTIASGLYNVGTGEARSFADLGKAVFKAMGREPAIRWVDMPEAMRPGYQYFTEATLERLRVQGAYTKPFTPMEEAVSDYVRNYLSGQDIYL